MIDAPGTVQSPQVSPHPSGVQDSVGVSHGRLVSFDEDAQRSVQSLLQKLRAEIECSFKAYEIGLHQILEQGKDGHQTCENDNADATLLHPHQTACDQFSTGNNAQAPWGTSPQETEDMQSALIETHSLEKSQDLRPVTPGHTARLRPSIILEQELADQKASTPMAAFVQNLGKSKTSCFEMAASLSFPGKPLLRHDSLLHRCAKSTPYKVLRAVIVVVDALLVVGELQRSAKQVADNRDSSEQPFFLWASSICCTFFWFDLLLAFLLEYPRFDIVSGRTGYRWLNVVAILQQTLELIGANAAPGKRFTSHFRLAVGHLIFLRIVRPMVIVPEMGGRQLHKTMGELHVMIRALTGTLQPLLWCTLMCLIIFLIFSVFFTEVAAAHLVHVPANVPETSADALLATTWGSVDRAVYSLFTATFGGQEWGFLYDVLDPLAWTTKFIFLGFICFTYIALLNTVTAVFIKCAFMRLEQDREFVVQQAIDEKREYLLTARHIFCHLDADCSGIIKFVELVQHLQEPVVGAYFSRLGVDTDEVEQLFNLMDEDGSGEITLDEFLLGCLRLKGQATSLDLEILHQDVKLVISTIANSQEKLRALQDCLNRVQSQLQPPQEPALETPVPACILPPVSMEVPSEPVVPMELLMQQSLPKVAATRFQELDDSQGLADVVQDAPSAVPEDDLCI